MFEVMERMTVTDEGLGGMSFELEPMVLNWECIQMFHGLGSCCVRRGGNLQGRITRETWTCVIQELRCSVDVAGDPCFLCYLASWHSHVLPRYIVGQLSYYSLA